MIEPLSLSFRVSTAKLLGVRIFGYFTTFISSVIISFPLEEDANVSMIAWTTTPWTLPSNMSLCVNPELDYVKVKGNISKVLSKSWRKKKLVARQHIYQTQQRFRGTDKMSTVDSEMFEFSLLFVNSLPHEVRVLTNIVLDSYSSYSNSHLRIQEIANNLEIKNLRNKGHAKISESTVFNDEKRLILVNFQ